MNCAMGVYASDVLIQNVTFINYYGAITMGALPACQPVGVHTDASDRVRVPFRRVSVRCRGCESYEQIQRVSAGPPCVR